MFDLLAKTFQDDNGLQLQFGLLMISIKVFKKLISGPKLKYAIFGFSTTRDQSPSGAAKQIKRWNDLKSQISQSQQAHSIQLYQQFLREPQNQQEHWNAHFQLAKIYRNLKKYNTAINHYSACLNQSTINQQCYLAMSQCLKDSGNIFEAINLLQAGLEKCQDKTEIANKLASIYCELQEYSKCFELYAFWRQILSSNYIINDDVDANNSLQNMHELILKIVLYPQSEQDLLALKDLFLNNDKVTQGVQFLKYVIEKNRYFSSLFALGSLLFQSGNCLDAKPYLLEAYQLKKQHYYINLFLATILQQQNKAEEAIKYFQIAFSIDKTNSQPLSCIGFIIMQNGNLREAATFFSKALSLNPHDALALTNLGIIALSTKKIKQGMNLLQRAIDLDPKNQLAILKLRSILHILGKEDQIQKFDLRIKNIQSK